MLHPNCGLWLPYAKTDMNSSAPLATLNKRLLSISQQGFSIMFSGSTTPLNEGNNGGDGGDNGNSNSNSNASAGESGGDGDASHSWGRGGGAGGPGEEKGGSGGNWQSSSSLSWLTNLRKGIMTGGMLTLVGWLGCWDRSWAALRMLVNSLR